MTPKSPLLQLATPLTGAAPDWPRIDSNASVRAAAKLVANAGSEGVVVRRSGKDHGIVRGEQLLLELAGDKDPLTGLPRSGALRDWLSERLIEGQEVAVAFIDLDDFGAINRSAGHTAGDEALVRAARAVQASCAETDFPARFGGDEFVVASVQRREEMKELAANVRLNLEYEGLQASIGFAGGRRRTGRRAHVSSTVEELLRLASQDCLGQKRDRKAGRRQDR